MNRQRDYEDRIRALETQLAQVDASRARIAAAAMAGADVVESVTYWNGIKQVAAYQKFDHLWMTTLLAEDMTYMRGVVGLPEPPKGTTP